MKISYSDIRTYGLDPEKEKSLTIADRFFYRKISNLLLIPLNNLFKLTPNSISVLSMIFAFVGFFFIIYEIANGDIIGILFLMVWAVLDCADGSLARIYFYKYNIRNNLGEYYDAMAGYFVAGGLWFSISFSLYLQTSNKLVFFIGSLSSILSLFSRLAYNKLLLVQLKNNPVKESNDSRKSFLYYVYENIEFGSLLLPLILFSIYMNLLIYMIYVYFFVNVLMVFWIFKKTYTETVNG